MRLATWNVNSIRTRVERVIAFLERADIDVLAMQEIKCKPEQFPVEAFHEAGYEVRMHGLNQWNGVAIASRLPIVSTEVNFPGQPGFGDPEVVEARALGVTVLDGDQEVTTWSLYVPNGLTIRTTPTNCAGFTLFLKSAIPGLNRTARSRLSGIGILHPMTTMSGISRLLRDKHTYPKPNARHSLPLHNTDGMKSPASASPNTPTGITKSFASRRTRECASTSSTPRRNWPRAWSLLRSIAMNARGRALPITFP